MVSGALDDSDMYKRGITSLSIETLESKFVNYLLNKDKMFRSKSLTTYSGMLMHCVHDKWNGKVFLLQFINKLYSIDGWNTMAHIVHTM